MTLRTLKQGRNCKGSVAIELALCLLVSLVFLTVPLFLGRYFWHYTVAQRAAHDAALYLSKVSKVDMKTLGPSGEPGAAVLARTIVSEELAELNPGMGTLPPVVLCEYAIGASTTWLPCNALYTPTAVKVSILMPFTDIFFQDSTSFLGLDGITIVADVQMPFVGT